MGGDAVTNPLYWEFNDALLPSMARQYGKTMGGLSLDAQAILDAARNSDDPRDEQCERVRRTLLATVVAAGAAAPLAASSTAVASVVVKVVVPIAFVLTSAVGAGVWWYARHEPNLAKVAAAERISAPASNPTTAPPIASVSPPVDVAKVVDVPRARRTTASSEARATPAPHNRLEEETKLLAQVNETLRAGDPEGALTLLDDYDQLFPAGVLREEMQATRVIAGCQATPSSRAQESARQFLTQHRVSPLASRVASSCRLSSR